MSLDYVNDLSWERSKPRISVSIDEAEKLMSKFINCKIESYEFINIGCRNSNYFVKTNCGKFVLRVSNYESITYHNEVTINRLFSINTFMPVLIYHHQDDDLMYFVYLYFEGKNLQSDIVNNKHINSNYLVRIAKSLAIIHNSTDEFKTMIKQNEFPPYIEWYDYFLSKKNTQRILGSEKIKEISGKISQNSDLLQTIDIYKSLIHGDFRPINMLVNKFDILCILDWEFVNVGHSLADIGQFFRYSMYFGNSDLKVFETYYNLNAKRKLPDNWFKASKLRDLVNPLQMLCTCVDKPNQEKDLINIVNDILKYL